MMQINSTQAVGLLAFIPAALAAAAAFGTASRSQRGGRGTWAAIAVLHTLLAVEIFAEMRHRLHRAIDDWLIAASVYSERRPAQVALLLVVVVLAALATRRIARLESTRRLAIARGATAALVTLFIVETISLHAVDAVLYRPAGPVLLIAWLWLACGWTTAAAAISRSK